MIFLEAGGSVCETSIDANLEFSLSAESSPHSTHPGTGSSPRRAALAKRGANRDTAEAGWQPLPEEDDAIVAAPGYDDDDDDATIVAAASTASVHARRFSAASRSKTDRAAAGGLPSLSGGAIVLGGESTEALFLFRGKKG
jgi:hypothetical protein